jgi:hypothetical protein
MNLKAVAITGVVFVLGFYALNSLTMSTANSNMQTIENQVADDQVAQYKIAVRGGTKMEVCVHAQMVAAAYLQSKDEENYTKWEAIQHNDCKAAGLPE